MILYHGSYLEIVKPDLAHSRENMDFVLACRRGSDATNYDIVIGGVANDKVFNTVELFLMV